VASTNWYAFKGYNNGKAISLGAAEQAEATAFGMHGYTSAAAAEAKPNSVNVLDKTQVNAWVVAANDITGNPVKDAQHAAKSVAKAAANATGATGAITSVEDFLTGLTQRNLWLRAAMLIGGGIVLIVGIAKLTGVESKAVNVAAKAVPFV
jgi:hypothetical protein